MVGQEDENLILSFCLEKWSRAGMDLLDVWMEAEMNLSLILV